MEQNNQDRYKMVIGESHVTTDDAFVAADVKAILDKHFDENNNVEVYKPYHSQLYRHCFVGYEIRYTCE